MASCLERVEVVVGWTVEESRIVGESMRGSYVMLSMFAARVKLHLMLAIEAYEVICVVM